MMAKHIGIGLSKVRSQNTSAAVMMIAIRFIGTSYPMRYGAARHSGR